MKMSMKQQSYRLKCFKWIKCNESRKLYVSEKKLSLFTENNRLKKKNSGKKMFLNFKVSSLMFLDFFKKLSLPMLFACT